MASRVVAVALWCVLVARAAAYTVDCNQEYTDCDNELSKLTAEDEELITARNVPSNTLSSKTTSTETMPTRSTSTTTEKKIEDKTETFETTTADVEITQSPKPKPRLLNLNVDELQTFANALHNQTDLKDHKKHLTDLSDVTLDGDDDEDTKLEADNKQKHMNDKFYTNLAAPFHPMLGIGSGEADICKENEVTYKIGEKIDRSCEETCECTSGGVFECSPRCKHPYVRRGRRLNDPLCFESPVDECCSIIACATGNGDTKPTKVEVCRYGNETYLVGTQWQIGCEQTCKCEKNSVVTCKPRCERPPPSDKCINVQDPNDVCCEVQVCDVSQDVHEEPENMTSTTTTTTEGPKSVEDYLEIAGRNSMRPLVLSEPIGSVKVLQNNTVQVNLIHMNNSADPIHLLLSSDNGKTFKDVELKYTNLILNLEGGKDYILKTKETGTKFNFTITSTNAEFNEIPSGNDTHVGCYHDGQFYSVGEEFHIGCTELCECTGMDTRECAALICPSHVGLELVSKGCVRWAPNPPASPPNCCPRSARCLSDGTCHYKGIAVPNWSEVPIEITGCEQRCYCENGELECQETCSPLPPVPPQSLRCPPMHRPAPVNISDDDCCKQWGCLPNAISSNKITNQYNIIPTLNESHKSFVTPIAPILPTTHTSVLPTPLMTTDPTEFYRHLNHLKTIPKFSYIHKYSTDSQHQKKLAGDNITVVTLGDVDSPLKVIHPELSLTSSHKNWEKPAQSSIDSPEYLPIPLHADKKARIYSYSNFVRSDTKMHDMIQSSPDNQKTIHDTNLKTPISNFEHFNYFLPVIDRRPNFIAYQTSNVPTSIPIKSSNKFFEPQHNINTKQFLLNENQNALNHNHVLHEHALHGSRGKHVTILRNKDVRLSKPNKPMWSDDMITHLLTKDPNPYETVLLRPIPSARSDISPITIQTKNSRIPGKSYSALDLEHILSQMEVESEVNRNLERSADKNRDSRVSGLSPHLDISTRPSHSPQHPGFLPTISPEIHFPQDDILDDEQNNIHRPVNALPAIPPGIHIQPNYGENNKKLSVISLQSDSPTSVMMLFGLPPVLVGLRGSVDLRYTDKTDEDISQWFSQVFAPADEVLTTPRLEFRLTGLKPSTTYKLRGKLYLHNLPVEPESEIYTVRTQDLPTLAPPTEKLREIDTELTVVDVNDTTAHVSWRHFTEDELQYIDGIQVRYRPVGTPIYSMTELLHHGRSAAELRELRPSTRYEAALVLVPPPRAATELGDPTLVTFTTAPYLDPYNWTVTIEARAIGSQAAELTWRGVPAPAERWVRVYRAAHACGALSPRNEHDAFRLAARDLPPAVTLTGLQPDTKCRVWLELFLTNGKVKTSNVLEINTKSLDSTEPVDNVIEAASSSIAGSRGDSRGDYYGALVIVGVVAALGALTSLLLLLVVVRRHRPRSVPITSVPSAPRESSLPPYDNPAYKLELQQETMDL